LLNDEALEKQIASDGKRKSTYGFKMHSNTDEDGFIKKMTFTAGNVHDSQELDKLVKFMVIVLIAMNHNLKTGMNIFKQMRSLQDCCV
jgi:hypothetical protein